MDSKVENAQKIAFQFLIGNLITQSFYIHLYISLSVSIPYR